MCLCTHTQKNIVNNIDDAFQDKKEDKWEILLKKNKIK